MAALSREMESIEQGGHLCLIYDDDPAEQMPALLPFLRAGLLRQEQCVYVADDQTTDEVAEALQQAGIDVVAEVASGALLLWSRDHWRQPGDLISDSKAAQVREIIDSALKQGFKGIRFAVEMTWSLGPDIDVERLRHWEATINEVFTPDVPARIVCQYSRARLTPAVIRAGLTTHPRAIVGSQVSRNPYYEAPFILKPSGESEQVDWMISMLRRAAAAEDSSAGLSVTDPGAEQPGDYEEAGRIAERLRDSEEDLRDFFENGPVGLHWVGPDGIVLRVNRAELAMLGYAEDEYVGRHIADFHVDRGTIDDILARVAAGETVHDRESELRCKDGTTRHVLIDSSALWRDGEFIHTRCFTRDVTESMAAAEVSSRLTAIIDSSDDAIVSKDLDGTIRSWNAGAERMFGYTAGEMLGQSIRRLIPADRQYEEDEVVAALRKGERVEHYETVRWRKDGSEIDISLSVAPIRDTAGRIIGASKIARDISLRKQANEAMAQSLRLKDEFLGLVSHELRTPIAIVVGNGDVLLRHGQQLDEEQTEQSLRDLVTQAKRLQQIIENLLLLSRMERQERVLVEPVHLERLARTSVDAFLRREPARPVSVTSDGPTLAMGEPVLLSMVLDNLLANADKYSPPGRPIEVHVANGPNETVEVHVLDRGIGLKDDELESVFTPFYRSASAQLQAAGMGLGLAVCERALTAQSGTISARQRDGGGAHFVMSLPRVEAPA